MENLCGTECNSTKSCKLDSCTPGVLPVVIGAPNTAISIDTETTSISSSDGEEWPSDLVPVSNDIGTGANAATITVESSTDVVIGPLTQFHGPVTIYQNVSSNTHPSELGRCKLEGVPNPQKNHHSDKNITEKLLVSCQKINHKQCRKVTIWIIIIATTIFVTAGIGVLVIPKTKPADQEHSKPPKELVTEPPNELVTEPPDELVTEPPDNEDPGYPSFPEDFPHKIYTRIDWGGLPSLNFTKPLQHPTEYVIISHTAGPFCAYFERCAELVRNIQADHMQTYESPDIGYNFLIGGDGNIYVGRGWDIQNIHANRNIGISIIGHYVARDIMTPRMVETLEDLLEVGVQYKKLATDYKLVCHNQTSSTASPGRNVCKKVAQFPNYYPGKIQLITEYMPV